MTHPSSGRSAAEDGGGETFLARARNGRSPGEESLTAAVAAQAIEAQPSFGQIKPSEAAWFARPTALRRRRGGYRVTRTRGRRDRAKQKKAWRSNGRPLHVQPPAAQRPIANRVAPDGGDASIRSKRCDDCYGDPRSAPTAIEIGNGGSSALPGRRRQGIRRYHAGGNALSGVGRGAESIMRAQAVAATTIAPAIAIACFQLSAGMPMCARPSAP